jgi:hypothetical protein
VGSQVIQCRDEASRLTESKMIRAIALQAEAERERRRQRSFTSRASLQAFGKAVHREVLAPGTAGYQFAYSGNADVIRRPTRTPPIGFPLPMDIIGPLPERTPGAPSNRRHGNDADTRAAHS